MFQKMVHFYNESNFPAPFALLSNQDVAGLIISLINEENETVDNVFKKLEKNLNAKIQANYDNQTYKII